MLTYWEGEKKRTINPPNGAFVNKKRETAVVHSSTYSGKIELGHQFARNWELLAGIGFRSSEIFQYGHTDKIKTPPQSVGSNVPPNPPLPDTIHFREVQSFRINSIILPVGFSYSLPLGNKVNIRLSTGAEIAYGHLTQEILHKELSTPTVHSFGCSVWARPELSYSFGKIQLFGFGTYNQTLLQQVKWDFEVKRNPAFGGGIGFRVEI